MLVMHHGWQGITFNTPATSAWPGRSFFCCAVSAAASGLLVMIRAGESAEGTSLAAMAALRMRAMEDWDRPAGTVRVQRTAEEWNLQGRVDGGTASQSTQCRVTAWKLSEDRVPATTIHNAASLSHTACSDLT